MNELECRECGERYGFFYKNSDGSHTCSHCYAIIEEQKEKEVNAQISAYNKLSKSQQTESRKAEIENSKKSLEKRGGLTASPSGSCNLKVVTRATHRCET